MSTNPDPPATEIETQLRLQRWSTRVGLGLILSLLLFGGWCYGQMHRRFAGWEGSSVDVVIPSGLSAGAMVDLLARFGVLRRPRVVRGWLALGADTGSLQAGEYRFERPATPLEVLDRLRHGEVLLHRVTIPEGLTLDLVAQIFVDGGFGPYELLITAFEDPTLIRSLDPDAVDLEGYLFPDTYQFPRNQSASGIARAMVRRFLEVAGPDYAQRSAAVGLTVRRAVTLASMVEKETSVRAERGRISRVFHNRLQRNMLMQCDPTVIYALKRANRPVERLTRADLAFDSPWNTYRSGGLPPGPIASPGEGSLNAAVAPAEGNDLYFVASPEGGHAFSPDLATHTRAVAVWRNHLRSSR